MQSIYLCNLFLAVAAALKKLLGCDNKRMLLCFTSSIKDPAYDWALSEERFYLIE